MPKRAKLLYENEIKITKSLLITIMILIIIILIIMKKKETPEQTLSCKNRTNTGREKLVMRCS